MYLDLLRTLAATVVFFSHIKRESLSAGNELVLFLGGYGQEGVAAFFVISGVVIAYVARNREGDMRSFFVARLGRLWSVVMPALLLTVALDVAGQVISPAMYNVSGIPAWNVDMASLWNFIGTVLFLNESSLGQAVPGTNGPFWSLCYEFWYYAMFAFAFYLRGAMRIVALVAACAIAGSDVLGLFPIWAMGLIVYMYLKGHSVGYHARLIWLISTAVIVVLMLFKYKLAAMLVATFPSQAWSANALVLYISRFGIGIFIAINIVSFDRMGGLALIKKFDRPIRFIAARSFSLYLYHVPLLFFFGAVTISMEPGLVRLGIVVVATLVCILILSDFTERRKAMFVKLADHILPKAPAGQTAPASKGVA